MSEQYDVALRREYALKVQSKPEFLDLFQASVDAELMARGVIVTDDLTEAEAVNMSLAFTSQTKHADKLRLEVVTMPKRFCKMVDDNFRTITDAFGRAKARVDGERIKYANVKKMAYEKAQAEAEKANREVRAVSPDAPKEAVQQLMFPEKPKTMVETEAGKQYVREVPYVEITDKEAVLKAIVSKAKGLEALTVELVEIDVKKLEEIVLKKKVKVPGTVIRIKQITVTQPK